MHLMHHLLDATICCCLILFYFKTFHLHELPKNHKHKTKKKVFAFTTWISAASFWLKDSTGGDGDVRVVGHSFAMDAPSTTSAASAIALFDKDVHDVNKSNNDGTIIVIICIMLLVEQIDRSPCD
jgi:hypothetical protein